MAGKLYIRTFGCQMNEYDSEIRITEAKHHSLRGAHLENTGDAR